MKSRLVDLCLMAMMGTVMVVSKETLAALPNVELVSLLTILFTLVFRRRVLGALAVFLMLEGLLYGGFGLWWLMYLYVWVPVHLAAAGGDYLAVPLDEAFLAVGRFVRPVRLGLWNPVLSGVSSCGRAFHDDRLDHQRPDL